MAPALALILALATTNGQVTLKPFGEAPHFLGFTVDSGQKEVARVELCDRGLIYASKCQATYSSLTFSDLHIKVGGSLEPSSQISVALVPGDPYPQLSFDLWLHSFVPAAWEAAAGTSPFHFLCLPMPNAEIWHQQGWLNATPLSDPFPLLRDRHAGTPEISAYTFNRRWGNTIPLGAQPIPVIGLWSPSSGHYVGLDFQENRLQTNSERDLATSYYWGGPMDGSKGDPAPQFVSLVYPFGGPGYQSLEFPKAGSRIYAHATLLWSESLHADQDPNRLFFNRLWAYDRTLLPTVPRTVDMSWLPGGDRLENIPEPPLNLISGQEKPFETDDTRLIDGWRWIYENPADFAKANNRRDLLSKFQSEADYLLRNAKHFTAGGEECVYWEKPIEGSWVDAWGGKGVTTLHNANGFAAGRLFLGLYELHPERRDYLKTAEGVLNWARHIVWTRDEFADVPSSPFAIGATLPIAFCLDYYNRFRPSAVVGSRAHEALELAHSFAYRYLVMWPSDNNRYDNLDSSFLWEPNSGRDWTGAACCNEICWNLDALAQVAVTTGDPILMWALQGSLSRWPVLYQEKYAPSLADYVSGDMGEGYGLYDGNVYGVGQHATYGFSSPLEMIEPIGSSNAHVLAGEKSAMCFDSGGIQTSITAYRWFSPGNFSFTVRSDLAKCDLTITEPYADLSKAQVRISAQGHGRPANLTAGFSSSWSLIVKGLSDGDRVLVGQPDESQRTLPSEPPLDQSGLSPLAGGRAGIWSSLDLAFDDVPDTDWSHLDSWAGLPRGSRWSYGIRFTTSANAMCMVRKPVQLAVAASQSDLRPFFDTVVALAYSAGGSKPPSLHLASGKRIAVDPSREFLVWKAWPPIYSRRLVGNVVVIPPGESVVGVDPGDRSVWAASWALMQKMFVRDGRYEDPYVSEGITAYRRMRDDESRIAELRDPINALPAEKVALLPPEVTGRFAAESFLSGLTSKAALLKPEDLVSGRFTPSNFPVAVYADSEDYVDRVHRPGDAVEAIVKYLDSGGTLVLAGSGPYPMFYATSDHHVDPLPNKLGLPINFAYETRPAGLQIDIAQDLPPEFPLQLTGRYSMSESESRLRSVFARRIPEGARYSSIATVRGPDGKRYGDAAGLLTLPSGGRILYVWNGLTKDSEVGPQFTAAIIRFVAAAAESKG